MTDDTRRRWGKAGVRLTDREAAANAQRRGLERFRNEASRERDDRIAQRLWSEGLVVPNMITTALDLHDLYGPEVDAACLAEEPEVDLWEAGKLYPTWEQLQALGRLTGHTPRYFTFRPLVSDCRSSLRFHLPEGEELPPRVLSYPDDVVARCPGTVLHAQRQPTA